MTVQSVRSYGTEHEAKREKKTVTERTSHVIRETGRQADRQTDRQRQRDRQTERETGRQRQTDRDRQTVQASVYVCVCVWCLCVVRGCDWYLPPAVRHGEGDGHGGPLAAGGRRLLAVPQDDDLGGGHTSAPR